MKITKLTFYTGNVVRTRFMRQGISTQLLEQADGTWLLEVK